MFCFNDMVPDITPFWTSQFEPAGFGPTSGQINPIFRPRLAERPNIQIQKTFFDYLFSVRIIERAKLGDFDRIWKQKID